MRPEGGVRFGPQLELWRGIMRIFVKTTAAAAVAALVLGFGAMDMATPANAAGAAGGGGAWHGGGGGGWHGGGGGGWHGGGGGGWRGGGGGWGNSWGPAVGLGILGGAIAGSTYPYYAYGYGDPGYGYGYDPGYESGADGCYEYRPIYSASGQYLGQRLITVCQ
jgi:hypothetical protein